MYNLFLVPHGGVQQLVIDAFKIFMPPWELTGGKGNIKFALLDGYGRSFETFYIINVMECCHAGV